MYKNPWDKLHLNVQNNALLKLVENITQTIPVAKHSVIIKTVWVRSISNYSISALAVGEWAALHTSCLSPWRNWEQTVTSREVWYYNMYYSK
jgi:hypothetical protein